jgi:hypothetical protein
MQGEKTYLSWSQWNPAVGIDSGDLLLFGRPSGLTSPSRTTFSGYNLSTKLKNLVRLIWPVGRRTTRTLAGATGDSWSSISTTFGMRLAFDRGGGLVINFPYDALYLKLKQTIPVRLGYRPKNGLNTQGD